MNCLACGFPIPPDVELCEVCFEREIQRIASEYYQWSLSHPMEAYIEQVEGKLWLEEMFKKGKR